MTESTQTPPPPSQAAEPTAENPSETKNPCAELEAKIAEQSARLKEQENKYLYLYAEFENFKKRALKEKQDLIKYGWESVARELLGVLDNLERALEHLPNSSDLKLGEGLRLVLSEFRNTLEKQGVQKQTPLYQPFDPNLHEAMAQETSSHPSGTIIREYRPGYTLHGRLLRPARVVVSGGPGDGKKEPEAKASEGKEK